MKNMGNLIGSTLTDIEVNVNGFTALYFENKEGEKFALDLCPIVRKLEKETAPEVPAQEQSKVINVNSAIEISRDQLVADVKKNLSQLAKTL
ncbi:hypothetical protein SDC9_89648 [bioreactor metagenome]|uniref:Uncharacterized protein n=1 Tax=bioreactor metagenome TaxID=1076179 RepID=A0A644ZQE1_9ZZZZ